MNDQQQLQARGIADGTYQAQLERLRKGFPYLRITASATPHHGLEVLDEDARRKALSRWDKYLADGGQVTKFVPASGAASRMFKALFAYVDTNKDDPGEGTPVAQLLNAINETPFRQELDQTLQRLHGHSLEAMLGQGRYHDIIEAIVGPKGMNYGQLPKGLLSFHTYPEGPRTPLEEQMVEGAQTAATQGQVNLHFTVSHDHKDLFAQKIKAVQPDMEKRLGVKYNITMSEQSPATDTVAGQADGQPFRDNDGRLVFRPGGHGALIHNLSTIQTPVVFIKNIDNVVPDERRADTILYKKVLGGVLMEVHDQIEALAGKLQNDPTPEVLLEAVNFMQSTLQTQDPRYATLKGQELAKLLLTQLDRPLRVCGMVRNEGEPGGGPFLAYNADGSVSPQILESTQIDPNNEAYGKMLKTATHFNPVDLVCYIRDLQGRPFDLEQYVDADTGFISDKSYQGRPLKAIELPGLWNGAMSHWNTVFVEVPADTFNPVKTVNDLLRPAHQPSAK